MLERPRLLKGAGRVIRCVTGLPFAHMSCIFKKKILNITAMDCSMGSSTPQMHPKRIPRQEWRYTHTPVPPALLASPPGQHKQGECLQKTSI